jgi:hypothetical protein
LDIDCPFLHLKLNEPPALDCSSSSKVTVVFDSDDEFDELLKLLELLWLNERLWLLELL